MSLMASLGNFILTFFFVGGLGCVCGRVEFVILINWWIVLGSLLGGLNVFASLLRGPNFLGQLCRLEGGLICYSVILRHCINLFSYIV
jgi:hypothetical protein